MPAERADGADFRTVYESAAKTIIATPYMLADGSAITVRVGKKGVFACMGGCYPANQCKHAREAREWFIAQGAEPAALPAIPIPTEGVARHG